jgi:hypothetical protein
VYVFFLDNSKSNHQSPRLLRPLKSTRPFILIKKFSTVHWHNNFGIVAHS